MNNSTRLAASLLLATGIVVSTVVLSAPHKQTAVVAATPAPVTLSIAAVSTNRLAWGGTRLMDPGHVSPGISAARARDLGALQGGLGSMTPVRQAVLAHVVKQSPPIECLCWVVSLDPAGWFRSSGPKGAPRRDAKWFLVFLDASTGQWLWSEAGDVS